MTKIEKEKLQDNCRRFAFACNCKELKIRSNEEFDSNIVCIVPEGTELEISEDKSEVYKIVTPFGAEGFVRKKYVKEK